MKYYRLFIATIATFFFLTQLQGQAGNGANYSLSFNGTGTYVDTAVGVIPASGDFTVEAWVNLPAAPYTFKEILSQGSSGNAFYMGTDTANKIRLGDGWAPGIAFPVGGWHHLALVKSSTNTIFYIDGTNKVSKGSTIPNPSASTSLRLGRQYGGYGEYWPGAMDDVRIWSRALSATEIQTNRLEAPTGSEPGLVAAWEFNEGRGSNCVSIGSLVMTNTITGGNGWVPSGVPWPWMDNALFFNGSSAYLDSGCAVIPTNGDFTVSCWAFCPSNSIGGHLEILSQGSSGNAFYLGRSDTGNVRMGESWMDTGVTFPMNSWHHFTLVKTGTNAIFYMDGTKRVTKEAIIKNPTTTSSFCLGRQFGAYGEFWPGAMDDVRVWNRALNATEVLSNLNSKLTGNEVGLVAAWNFDEGAGATAESIGSTNILFSVTNGATWMASPVSWRIIFTNQPVNVEAEEGDAVQLNVSAVSGLPISYQWYGQNRQAIPRGTNATLDWPHITMEDAGVYYLMASNSAGTAVSRLVRVMPTARLTWKWLDSDLQFPQTNLIHSPFTDKGGTFNSPMVAISTGANHCTALKADNRILVWGDDETGMKPVTPGWASNFVAIASGYYHVLGLNPNGTVSGFDLIGSMDIPVSVTNVVGIAGGGYFSMALKADGTVVNWGDNSYGQTNVPDSATNVVAIAAGGSHCLALRMDGSVVSWGYNYFGQTNVPASVTNVIAIAGGSSHCLALRADGSVVTWGYSAYGLTNIPASATNIIAIAAGQSHSLALKADGTLVSWGQNSYGLTNVAAFATNIVAVAAASDHSLALKKDGTAIAWGVYHGPSFFSPNIPATVPALQVFQATTGTVNSDVAGVYTLTYSGFNDTGAPYYTNRTIIVPATPSATNNLASKITGSTAVLHGMVNPNGLNTTVWFEWGVDTNYGNITPVTLLEPTNQSVAISSLLTGLKSGQTYHFRLMATNTAGIGVGSDLSLRTLFTGTATIQLNGPSCVTNEWRSAFVDPGAVAIQSPVAISSGNFHCLALKPDGSLAAWGVNDVGQCNIPQEAKNIVFISCAEGYNLVARADGHVVAWLWNGYGQSTVPNYATNVIAVAGGYGQSMALKEDGTVIVWGGTGHDETVVPSAATNISSIAAGDAHCLALRADGSIIAWGWNYHGQCNIPPTATNIVAVDGGFAHTVALRADGTVLAWGLNDYGQASVPSTATNVVAIAAGYRTSLALKADGTVIAWGLNDFGQSTVPAIATNVVAIAAGHRHNIALKADGNILAWGDDTYRQTDVSTNIWDTSQPVSTSGAVDVNTPGIYQLTYSYTNASGSVAMTNRTVVVAKTVFSLPVLGNLVATGNNVEFTMSGDFGQTVVVETCTNLSSPIWLPIQTNTLGNVPVKFTIPVQLQQTSRFYRLRCP